MNKPSSEIKVLSDAGSGRTFITVIDDEGYMLVAKRVVEKLSTRARCILLHSPPINSLSWESLSASFRDMLLRLNIRVASLVGLGAGATLCQNLALYDPKVVRTLVMVDSPSRPHPSWIERGIDSIEEWLPFGLPMRIVSRGFNVKAYVHRLRCPMLLIATSKAGAFVESDLQASALRAPTAWSISLKGSDEELIDQLSEALLAFQEVPAKCPQKIQKV